MHSSIRFKLFLTFLATTLTVVLGMGSFMLWSFSQGFSEFTKTRHQERLKSLIESLTEDYSHDEGWTQLANDKQKWIKLLQESNQHRRNPFWSKQALTEPNNFWPPEVPADQQPKRAFIPFEMRVMLLDADKKPIFGRSDFLQQTSLTPIQYQDKTVGFLGLLPTKTIHQPSEVEFIERQSMSFIWIVLLMLGLSAAMALALAYILGRPIMRIATAAKQLAVGKYDVRLGIESNDELGQLARDFNDMAAALEKSEQARRQWVADISHELRTPLAIVRGELEALQDGIRPLNPAAIESLLADIMRINRLTEDLYQLSLSDQGALSYRKSHVNPVAILQEDIETLKLKFKNKNIAVTMVNRLQRAVNIYADPDRLSQLFRNILKNSSHYTDSEGQLIITVSRRSGKLRFEFSDSAPGLPENELSNIFNRFYRPNNSSQFEHDGAGLGLAICNNIVKAHEGSIHASTSSMNGLCIRIDFPISL